MAGNANAKRTTRKRRAPRKAPVPVVRVPVENILPGTILHLGDGRRIGFGEQAMVGAGVAERLVERAQARRFAP
jgi:hypothetical protein